MVSSTTQSAFEVESKKDMNLYNDSTGTKHIDLPLHFEPTRIIWSITLIAFDV